LKKLFGKKQEHFLITMEDEDNKFSGLASQEEDKDSQTVALGTSEQLNTLPLSLNTVFSEDSDDDFYPYELEKFSRIERVVPKSTIRPCPRFSFCSVSYSGGLYVWGGRSSLDDFKVVENSMWRFDFKERHWERLVPANSQESRTGATAVLHNGCIWIFGGYHSKYTNTMIKYDIKNNRWEREETNGPDPPRRWHYSAVKYKNSIWMFGGTMDRTHYNDFYEFNIGSKTWRSVPYSNQDISSIRRPLPLGHKCLDAPYARRRHTALVWDDAMWVVGGREGTNLPQDLIRYDFETQRWSRCDTPSYGSQCQFPKCADHSSWIDERAGCFFILGAKDNLIVRFHFDTNTMVPITSRRWLKAGLYKVTTHHGSAVFNDGKLYIFGGHNQDKTISNEIYSLDIEFRPRYTQNMKHLLANKVLSDVTFVVEGHEIPGHKVVLLAQCDFFSSLFTLGSLENRRIPIENCTVKVFIAVLWYLYADEVWIPKTVEQLLQMLTLVDLFRIETLRDHCVQLLKMRVTKTNAIKLLKAANTYELDSLKEQCCHFIVSHIRYFVQHKLLISGSQNELLDMILKTVADRLDPVKMESCYHRLQPIDQAPLYGDDPRFDAAMNY